VEEPAGVDDQAIEDPVGLSPATETMLTIRPGPWAFMTGATALISRIGPVRFTAMIRSGSCCAWPG